MYDYAPEVCNYAEHLIRNNHPIELVQYSIFQHKMTTLRNYMNLKSAREGYLTNVHKYNLNNSIVPAIQEHIMINMNIHPQKREDLCRTALSYKNVQDNFRNACRSVQDWTQAIDYGPFEQSKTIKFNDEEPDALGPCEADTMTTCEFYDLKRFQVD